MKTEKEKLKRVGTSITFKEHVYSAFEGERVPTGKVLTGTIERYESLPFNCYVVRLQGRSGWPFAHVREEDIIQDGSD